MDAQIQPTAAKALKPLAPKPTNSSRADHPPAAQKKTRASKPKVRTGCKTCKIRRVKCDEAKPVCHQCRRARIVCDGYNALWTPCSAPSSKRFSAREVPFFDFFRHALTSDFTGYICADFWYRVVLCEAMTSDCVRHAVLAIAALSAAIFDSTMKPSALFPWMAGTVVNSKHHVALHHYVKALSQFRKQFDASVKIESPRAVMIMSLLLITFELLQGNMEGVDLLMTGSIKLLKPSLTQCRQVISASHPSQEPTCAEDDVRDIEHILPFLSITGGFTPFLPNQSANLALWDTSPTPLPSDLNSRDSKHLQTEWSRFFSRASAFTASAFTTISQIHPTIIPHHLITTQQSYLTHLSTWKDLLATALTHPLIPHVHHSLRLIQLHHKTLAIGIQCCLDPTDTAWDLFNSEFETIIDGVLSLHISSSQRSNPSHSLRSLIQRKPKYHASFTLSFSLLSTLGPAITKCRDHNIRMRALALAKLMPWREGAWDADAELYGKLGAVLLEERGRREDGFIPPEERWNWVGGTWDLQSRKMVARYVSGRDEFGEVKARELELGLDGWVDVCGAVRCAVDHGLEFEDLRW